MAVAAVLTFYTAIRYGYRWAETDSAAFIRAIRGVQSQQTIAPPNAYPNGFGYQTIVIALSEFTGLSIVTLQMAVLPFLSIVVALCAFLTMRALTGSTLVGGLASILLFIQPEFLFVIQRGNHEKVTHIFLLSLLYLIVLGCAGGRPYTHLVAYGVAYYLTLWALITTNSFFASSFVAAFGLVAFSGVVALRFARAKLADHRLLTRFRYTAIASFVLLFLFITYVYTPAEHGVALYQIMFEQVVSIFEPEQSTAASPYGTINATWSPPWAYPLLTSFTISIILVAGLTWLWMALRFRRCGVDSSERHLLVLWLFAAVFALQVLASLVIDYSGFLDANLQIRLLPVFMLVGVPMAVYGVVRVHRAAGPRAQRAMVTIAPVLVAFFALAGVLKATNDPLVSNKWLFFVEDEQQALAWVDERLNAREVWIDVDERLRTMQDIHQPVNPAHGNIYRTGFFEQPVPYVLRSDLMVRRMIRMDIPLPDFRMDDRIYDNGSSQVFHRVPQTSYQP
jgi:hypothetical protein